jgi:hypothetical protein
MAAPIAKRGRPRALTKQLQDEVCERIAKGETLRQISASEHMPTSETIRMEAVRSADFAAKYARAREAQLDRWEDELIEIADDGTNDWQERENADGSKFTVADRDHIARSKLRSDTRKWIMSKRLPKKYGDRIMQEHSGSLNLGLADRIAAARKR